MKTYLNYSILLAAFLFLTACAAKSPALTQLQIRQYQTKTYDTADTTMAMKAVLNVLQDEAYIVKQANTELGFLTATKEVDVENGADKFFSSFFMGSSARWDKNSIIEVTANLTSRNSQTRVRLNFQRKTLDNKGNVADIEQLQDEAFYRDFFAKVDKGIFIEKEKI